MLRFAGRRALSFSARISGPSSMSSGSAACKGRRVFPRQTLTNHLAGVDEQMHYLDFPRAHTYSFRQVLRPRVQEVLTSPERTTNRVISQHGSEQDRSHGTSWPWALSGLSIVAWAGLQGLVRIESFRVPPRRHVLWKGHQEEIREQISGTLWPKIAEIRQPICIPRRLGC